MIPSNDSGTKYHSIHPNQSVVLAATPITRKCIYLQRVGSITPNHSTQNADQKSRQPQASTGVLHLNHGVRPAGLLTGHKKVRDNLSGWRLHR